MGSQPQKIWILGSGLGSFWIGLCLPGTIGSRKGAPTGICDNGDGNALEWAGTRRDVVFCSVVVTTSVITSSLDDELTEPVMVTKIISSRSVFSN